MLGWSGISREFIDLYWPHVEPMLRPVIEKSPDYFTVENVKADLKSGAKQLWLVHDGPELRLALVTEIEEVGKTRICRLQFLGGRKLKEAWHLFDKVIPAWAREQRAECMMCYPRPGLAKLLKTIGFQFVKPTEIGALYYKDLLNETRVH